MFSDNQVVSIQDGKFTMNQHINNHYTSFQGLESLKSAVASSAFHNSEDRFDPPKCHIRTREAVLARIMQWARREIDNDKPIMWVYGAAGTGKSAIEQTIAERCDAEDGGMFLSSFFFSRSDGSRNHSKAFVPTIAYQMTVFTPSLRPLIESTLDKDPLLLSRSLETQMTRLIIQPFQSLLARNEVVGRYFIIIDGLDECMDGTRVQIIQEIWRLVFTFRNENRFIASFASRPEPDIKSTFLYTSVSELLTRIALDDDYRADNDIRLFLSDKFTAIKRTRPRISKAWPTPSQLETLVYKASGQFIYASTVYNFVSSPHHNPVKRLDVVLGLAPVNGSSPFAQLDALYRQILLSVPPDCVDEGIKTIVSVHVMSLVRSRVHIPSASQVTDIDESDFLMHLDNYASIVATEACYVRPLHASLGDFLFDAERSQDLYRDLRAQHALIFERLMQYLASTPWTDTGEADSLTYAFTCSIDHLHQAVATPSVLEHLEFFFQPAFFENVTNPPRESQWTMPYRVYMAMTFIFSRINVLVLPSLKEDVFAKIKEKCRDTTRQLITTFMAKTSPEIRRLLKLLVVPPYQQYLRRFRHRLFLSDILRTIFDAEMISYSDHLSQQNVVSQHFSDPSVPETERFLQAEDYVMLARHLLLYLHLNILPQPRASYGHKCSKSCKYRAWISMPETNNPSVWSVFESPWPKYPAVVHPRVFGDCEKAAAGVVARGAYLALVFLPFLLEHAPLSYRLLQLCQPPNTKRFPWIVCPKHARNAAKAMSKYRNQFKPRRVLHVKGTELVPKNNLVEEIMDGTRKLELS